MMIDMHVHSKYSKDSLLEPAKIIKVAEKRGLDGIAVTDHNTIKGGVEAIKANTNKDFKIICGSEIKTEYGDIIGLYINEEIKSRQFKEVTDEIKRQGGLVILAHPFRKGVIFPQQHLDRIDVVEVFNSRSNRTDNIKALELAKKYNKPLSAGSDAHLSFEVGGSFALFNDTLLDCKVTQGHESNYYVVHGLSFTVEKLKALNIG